MAYSQPAIVPDHSHHPHIDEEVCPWCEQDIPHEKFAEIKQNIERKQRERFAEFEQTLKAKSEAEKAQLTAKAEADLKEANRAAAARLEQAKIQSADREKQAVETAKQQTTAAFTQQLEAAKSSNQELTQTIAKLKSDTEAKVMEAQETGRKAAAEAMQEKVEQAEKAKTEVELKLTTMAERHEENVRERLVQQREILDQDKQNAVNLERHRNFEDKTKLQNTVDSLKRQLEQKTAEELGEGAEVDLFEELKAAFPGDLITRVQKGAAGVDIIHEVRHEGKVCGKIVYDSKNRNAWRNDYVTKLRSDQLAAKADHAVLSSAAFPSGTKQLHIQDSVVIINPLRAVTVAEMLRKHMVTVQGLRLSGQARNEKTAQLYDLMTSERGTQHFERVESLTETLEEVDVQEQKAHTAIWKKRGELIKTVQRVNSEFSSEIDRIVCATTDGDH
ncbi:DUF2130 domain-containing protein [uncultured Tateyamaria sp.]|uniref:DUF2130 domain-containing protein n=1 Tax=uncultured Tateyamaria sp. TaxID=455651 RepID=UPI002605DB86|nr:DUF2130 domain-containing protein [uncultured Tateyamaria sp.]